MQEISFPRKKKRFWNSRGWPAWTINTLVNRVNKRYHHISPFVSLIGIKWQHSQFWNYPQNQEQIFWFLNNFQLHSFVILSSSLDVLIFFSFIFRYLSSATTNWYASNIDTADTRQQMLFGGGGILFPSCTTIPPAVRWLMSGTGRSVIGSSKIRLYRKDSYRFVGAIGHVDDESVHVQ